MKHTSAGRVEGPSWKLDTDTGGRDRRYVLERIPGKLADDRLSWTEICARYPDERVTMVAPEWSDPDCTELTTAIVVLHSADYVASWPDPHRAHDEMIVHFFTGRPRSSDSLDPR